MLHTFTFPLPFIRLLHFFPFSSSIFLHFVFHIFFSFSFPLLDFPPLPTFSFLSFPSIIFFNLMSHAVSPFLFPHIFLNLTLPTFSFPLPSLVVFPSIATFFCCFYSYIFFFMIHTSCVQFFLRIFSSFPLLFPAFILHTFAFPLLFLPYFSSSCFVSFIFLLIFLSYFPPRTFCLCYFTLAFPDIFFSLSCFTLSPFFSVFPLLFFFPLFFFRHYHDPRPVFTGYVFLLYFPRPQTPILSLFFFFSNIKDDVLR